MFNGLSSIPARAKELISDLTLEAQSPKSEVGRVELREDGKLHATPFGGRWLEVHPGSRPGLLGSAQARR